MIKIYGIKNCDTVKKALNWLAESNLEYQFHDYKKSGIDDETLEKFIKEFTWQKVLNSQSRTFRQLSDQEKPTTQASAIKLMKLQNSIIKRPIIIGESVNLLGFDIKEYQKTFNKK